MEKKLVKIDLRSLKPNPHAGQTVIHQYVGQNVWFTFDYHSAELPKIITHDKRFRLSGWEKPTHSSVYTHTYRFYGKITDRLLAKLFAKVGEKNVKYEAQNIYQSYNTMTPQASHLYKHVDARVKCKNCGATPKLSELMSDTDYDFGGNRFEYEDMCPKCEQTDCCDPVEYETLEAALKRQNAKSV